MKRSKRNKVTDEDIENEAVPAAYQLGAGCTRAALFKPVDKNMSEQKNVKPIAQQEDLFKAVAAARTAWILTDVDDELSRSFLRGRSIQEISERMLLSRKLITRSQCSYRAGKSFRCIN